MSQETKEPKCEHPGCRKRRVAGAFCRQHQSDSDPLANVTRLSELEALKWARLDAEIRNALQGLRLADLEISEAKRAFFELRNLKEIEKTRLQGIVDRLKPEYQRLVEDLGQKYKVNPKSMVIDPDSCTIRDLSAKVPEPA